MSVVRYEIFPPPRILVEYHCKLKVTIWVHRAPGCEDAVKLDDHIGHVVIRIRDQSRNDPRVSRQRLGQLL